MKDNLIQIIKSVPIIDKVYEGYISDIAEKLICEGVSVPPCKVGDTVYFILEDTLEEGLFISGETVTEVCSKGFFVSEFQPPKGDLGFYTLWDDLGKNVFLSREEAEKALKGNNNE